MLATACIATQRKASLISSGNSELERGFDEQRDGRVRRPIRRPRATAPCAEGEAFTVYTEDCFSGGLTTTSGKPRELAPYLRVNPLTGPVFIGGVKAGDIVAVRLLTLGPAREWAPRQSCLISDCSPVRVLRPISRPSRKSTSGSGASPKTDFHFSTEAANGMALIVPFRPFRGTLGVAPAHGRCGSASYREISATT